MALFECGKVPGKIDCVATLFPAGNFAYPTTLHYITNTKGRSRLMARQMRNVKLMMANGDTTVVQVKTTTESYIRRLIADMIWLPAKVMRWEVLA